jgi:hypothetical protein
MSSDLRERLRAALSAAMEQRDTASVAVLRSALAALDNAGAVPVQDTGSAAIEASPVGPGAREAPRRELSDDDLERLLQAEISERQDAARVYEQAGRQDQARRLREEAGTLAAFTARETGR